METDVNFNDSSFSDDDDDDTGTFDDTDGVVFDSEKNTWIPNSAQYPGMTLTQLPVDIPLDASPWIMSRQEARPFIRAPITDPFVLPCTNQYYMQGNDCKPNVNHNCECGVPWEKAKMEQCGHFVLRTGVGAVIHKRLACVCSCGRTLDWNPASEYIHSISPFEGGINLCSFSR